MAGPRFLVAPVLALPGVLLWLAGHLSSSGTGLGDGPRVVSGDEPHYLLVINSLLQDRDLALEDEYRRVRLGGLDAGLAFRGRRLDHHTFLLNRHTGKRARWHEAYDWTQSVECDSPDCVGFALRLPEFAPGPEVREVSSHPVAFPALLAALLLPFRIPLERVEVRAIEIVGVLTWLVCIVTYLAGRRSGMSLRRALAAAMLTGLASPVLAYGRSLFPETTTALVAVLALWALQANRPAWAGLACAVAIALKPPFAVIAVGFSVERLWARQPRSALVIGGIAVVTGLAVATVNLALAGTPVIAGTEPWRWADGLGPLCDTLVGAQHGLLRFVPWTLLVLASAVYTRPSLAAPADASEALFRQIALPLVLYVLLLAARADPPGSCWGPRYWVAFLPFLALAVMHIAQSEGRAFTIALLALALLSVPLAVAAAIRYPLVFDRGPVDTLFANPFSSHATSAAAGTAPSATTVSKKR